MKRPSLLLAATLSGFAPAARAALVAFDRRVLDRAVHSLDLPIGPRMVHLGQTELDAMLIAGAIEDVLAVVDVPLT